MTVCKSSGLHLATTHVFVCCRRSEQKRLALLASMAHATVPVCVKILRRWKLRSTANTHAASVGRFGFVLWCLLNVLHSFWIFVVLQSLEDAYQARSHCYNGVLDMTTLGPFASPINSAWGLGSAVSSPVVSGAKPLSQTLFCAF